MEKCLSWINIRPNEQVVDLVTSPIFLLQIVVKFVKGLCSFFFQAEIAGFLAMEQLSSLGKTILTAHRNVIVHLMVHLRQNVYMYK